MRIDGPSRRVVCLMVVDDPLIGTGPILKYFPISGNWPSTGCDDVQLVELAVIPARNLRSLDFLARSDRLPEAFQQKLVVVRRTSPAGRSRSRLSMTAGDIGVVVRVREPRRGTFGHRFAKLFVSQRDEHRRGCAFFHLAVPVAEQRDGFGEARVLSFELCAHPRRGVPGRHNLCGKEIRKRGVNILLHGEHLGRLPFRAGSRAASESHASDSEARNARPPDT